jgi:hypothetical protein
MNPKSANPFRYFKLIARGDPGGSHAICPVPAEPTERRGFAVRARDRYLPCDRTAVVEPLRAVVRRRDPTSGSANGKGHGLPNSSLFIFETSRQGRTAFRRVTTPVRVTQISGNKCRDDGYDPDNGKAGTAYPSGGDLVVKLCHDNSALKSVFNLGVVPRSSLGETIPHLP